MSEKTLWNKVKKWLPGVAERVENLCDPGTPDVHGVCEGGEYWVELKAPGTLLEPPDAGELLNPRQRAWFLRRLPLRPCLFMLVEFKKDIRLYCAFRVKNVLYLNRVFECPRVIRKEKGVLLRANIETICHALSVKRSERCR